MLARSHSSPLSTMACAASGVWHEPPNARDTARSAAVQAKVSVHISGCNTANRSLRCAAISMPSAPCPAAGSACSSGMNERTRSFSPKRITPAAARMMASNCPSSNLRKRVSRLPRSAAIFKCGKRACNCAERRRLEVPTTAPAGKSSSEAYWLEMNASCAFSRAVTQASAKPSGRFIGTSLSECTAISAEPLCNATSSSLTNRPLPPILDKL